MKPERAQMRLEPWRLRRAARSSGSRASCSWRVPRPPGWWTTFRSADLEIDEAGAGPDEARALEVAEGGPLVRVSRVLLMEGAPAAWMVDHVPADVVGAERVRESFRPDAMLLDLLVSEGVLVASSQMSIEAVMIGPEDAVGAKLKLEALTAALSLAQTMYLVDGRPVQRSHDTFLPGKLNLHVVRELFEVRTLV